MAVDAMSETIIEQSGLSQEQQQKKQLLRIMSLCLLVGGVSYAIISLVMQSPEAFGIRLGVPGSP